MKRSEQIIAAAAAAGFEVTPDVPGEGYSLMRKANEEFIHWSDLIGEFYQLAEDLEELEALLCGDAEDYEVSGRFEWCDDSEDTASEMEDTIANALVDQLNNADAGVVTGPDGLPYHIHVSVNLVKVEAERAPAPQHEMEGFEP